MPPNTGSDNKPANNPNEHLVIPQWLNEDYFVGILEKHEPEFHKIQQFQRVAATAPGENYTSIMVRVIVDVELKDGSNKQLSYIVKTAFETNSGTAEMISNMNLFPKEKYMYQTLLPAFVKLYKWVGVDVELGPKCLLVEQTPERITLVMEDLRQRKFANVDRLKGLDFAHTEQVLRKLAELHAVSAIYHELNGPFAEMFHTSFYQEANKPMFEAMAAQQQASYIAAMRDWDLENIDYYIAKLPDIKKAFEEGMKLNKAYDDEFNVLNHGDCWTNNVLFAHNDKGDIEETLFVDFQVGRWGSPAQDLWYFLLSSTSPDVRVKEFDHFVHIYHKRLMECLNVLKYPKEKIPTLKDLHIKMLKHSFWSSLATTGVMTVILYPSDKDANMENFLNPGPPGEILRKKLYTNPLYVDAMVQLLPFLDSKGILDI